ncbi:hypothetical protein [Flavobacterium sp.]|uniref:hypothetical protein n=1 Tax=Flavobacterium sp. TaxID=239 RepID=UPI0037531A53
MTTPAKPRTTSEKFRDVMIIYVLPIFCVGYVNYTKCWPYQALIDFYKGTAGQHAQWLNDDIIYTISFTIFAGIYYALRYLIKKIF